MTSGTQAVGAMAASGALRNSRGMESTAIAGNATAACSQGSAPVKRRDWSTISASWTTRTPLRYLGSAATALRTDANACSCACLPPHGKADRRVPGAGTGPERLPADCIDGCFRRPDDLLQRLRCVADLLALRRRWAAIRSRRSGGVRITTRLSSHGLKQARGE